MLSGLYFYVHFFRKIEKRFNFSGNRNDCLCDKGKHDLQNTCSLKAVYRSLFSLEIYSGYRLVRNEPWLRIWWPLIANVEIFSILQMSDIYITLYIVKLQCSSRLSFIFSFLTPKTTT